jgi:hypothetical protein
MQTLDPPFVSALAALGAAVLMVYAGVGKKASSRGDATQATGGGRGSRAATAGVGSRAARAERRPPVRGG